MRDRGTGARAGEVVSRHDVAMDVTHRVRVPAPLDEAWEALQEPGRLAGVLPGTTVDAASGDTFSGSMKLKLGSALLTLVGDGRYASRDAGACRVVVRTTGADRRGDAAVQATHTVTLTGVGGGHAETDVTVTTSMTWSGRPARLGDGVVADTVDRVLQTTTGRIAARVAAGLPWVPRTGDEGWRDAERAAKAVVDHPVELGADLGDFDDPPGTGRPAPSASPRPAPPPPEPMAYVYPPYSNTAEPHVDVARTIAGALRSSVLRYAGLGALAVFVAVAAVRRVRR